MNVVFDCAGVLFHWQPLALVSRLLPHRATTPAQARDLVSQIFQGYGGDWSEFDRGRLDAPTLAARIARRTDLSVDESRQIIDAVPLELQPSHDMTALLHALAARGHVLHYLSNMPAAYADHLERSFDMFGLFRCGVFSARVGLVKPEPAIFDHAARSFGVPPQEMLFIDDVVDNVEAARRAGWQGLWFEDAPQCRQSLVRAGLL